MLFVTAASIFMRNFRVNFLKLVETTTKKNKQKTFFRFHQQSRSTPQQQQTDPSEFHRLEEEEDGAAVWPDLPKFLHFGKILIIFGIFDVLYYL